MEGCRPCSEGLSHRSPSARKRSTDRFGVKWFVPRDLRDVRREVIDLMHERGYPRSHTDDRADVKELNRRISIMEEIMGDNKPGHKQSPEMSDDSYRVHYEVATTLLAGLIAGFDLDVKWGERWCL